jgi:carboxymethylenebutenolidase
MPSQTMEIVTPDGIMDCAIRRPEPQPRATKEGDGPWPAVLLLMDALGVRPTMLEMAERLAGDGFFVAVPNLLYRAGAFKPFDPVTIWTDQEDRARLAGMLKAVTPVATMRDLGLLLDRLALTPEAKGGPVGCVGYCLGGQMTLRLAAATRSGWAAAASIHGGYLVTEEPDSAHLSVSAIRARLYLAGADEDRTFTPENRAVLTAALDAAGVRYQYEEYAGFRHGFAVRDLPPYDATAAERHWQRVLALFHETLD